MKKKTNYEVEGCWSIKKILSRCRACGTKFQQVPRQGHYNSKYWELERNDGQVLVCCPNGCNVKEGLAKMNEYFKIRHYCTVDSQSYNYKLDYNKIQHAWIDRKGKVYPVGLREHVTFCREHDTEERELEKKGWLKLISKEFMWDRKLSKRQIDVVFDYIMIEGSKEDIKKFKKEIDREIGMLKLQ